MRMFGFVLSAFVLIISTLVITPSFAQNFSGHMATVQEGHAKALQKSNVYMTLFHMKERAKTLAMADLSCQSKADCAQFGMGRKACGGPSGFVLTSRSNAYFQELALLAEDTGELEASADRQFGTMGICTVEAAPQFDCVRNICQTK